MKFVDFPRDKLHEILGQNCYKAMLGVKDPYIDISSGRTPILHYHYFSPGKPKLAREMLAAITSYKYNDFAELTLKGCKQDGLKVLGDSFGLKKGYQTGAVFINDNTPSNKTKLPDFHFALCKIPKASDPSGDSSLDIKDCLWQTKVPFHQKMVCGSIEEVALTSGYDFLSFLRIPRKVDFKCLSNAKIKRHTFKNNQRHKFTCFEILNPDDIALPYGIELKLNPDIGTATNVARQKYMQMPSIPSHPDPIIYTHPAALSF